MKKLLALLNQSWNLSCFPLPLINSYNYIFLTPLCYFHSFIHYSIYLFSILHFTPFLTFNFFLNASSFVLSYVAFTICHGVIETRLYDEI